MLLGTFPALLHPARLSLCHCGRAKHYRQGTDCALCDCEQFRWARSLRAPPPD